MDAACQSLPLSRCAVPHIALGNCLKGDIAGNVHAIRCTSRGRSCRPLTLKFREVTPRRGKSACTARSASDVRVTGSNVSLTRDSRGATEHHPADAEPAMGSADGAGELVREQI